jgi:hypothetical protein
MYIDDIIAKIILIPRVLRKSENLSIEDLLKQIGYFLAYNEITEDLIYKKLSQCQECIDEWIAYSEDKRTNEGYYIKLEGKEYIVGYLGKNENFRFTKFGNKINACASYIKKELEEIRKLS